jgi:stearoyl-CoA desaturase (delta-9 desaturase)
MSIPFLLAARHRPKPYDERIDWWRSVPFFGVHVAALVGVLWLGWSTSGLLLALALYVPRMFGITAGYHRYFSHRAFKAGRFVQFFFALLGTLSTQKGVLWWASHHRHHHKYSDEPEDIHSVKQHGFYWGHMGWILCRKYQDTDWKKIQDFAKYPELRWLNEHHLIPPIAMAVLLYLTLGGFGLVWGFFVSTTLLWHGTFTINSLSHLWGTRRYPTTDDSRNNFVLALITLGEGWHNNHHHYQRAVNQGFYWWEIDVSYYVLRLMAWFRLVSDLSVPPRQIRDQLPVGT